MLLRLATGIPLGIIAIWLMAFPSGWVQFAGVALVAVFALRELHRLLGLQTNGFPNGSCAPWGYVFLLLIMLLVHLEAWGTMTLWMAGFFIALALHQLRRYPLEDAYLREPGLVFLASTYLGIGLGCLFQLRVLGEQWMASGLMPAGNLNLVALIPMLATWGYDSSALFAGAATGTLPMAPQISPKKSWEGVTGGLVGGAAILVLGTWVFWAKRHGVQLDLEIYVGVAVLGVLCGAASQLGDLFMSCLKRQAQVKDSANLIPSQGGLLDKLDGLLFVLPVALGYLMIVGRFWEASRAG